MNFERDNKETPSKRNYYNYSPFKTRNKIIKLEKLTRTPHRITPLKPRNPMAVTERSKTPESIDTR